MNAWAAGRVLKRVTVNLRERHLAQRTPACSSVRLSPTFARTASAVSTARRMSAQVPHGGRLRRWIRRHRRQHCDSISNALEAAQHVPSPLSPTAIT
jgi:hypothetical protein